MPALADLLASQARIPRVAWWYDGMAGGLRYYKEMVQGPPLPEIAGQLTQSELTGKLTQVLGDIGQAHFSDATYQLSTLAEMGRFVAWYRKYWRIMVQYIAEKSDCDDFSDFFLGLTMLNAEWCSLPWGQVWGVGGSWGLTGHAWNFFLAQKDGEVRFYFLEPQTGFLTEVVPEIVQGLEIWLLKI